MTNTNSKIWFKNKDIKILNQIELDDLHGYVLPHASTSVTGHIISHTFQFRPTQIIKRVIIIYYPASNEEDVIINKTNKYYHEFYVPWMAFLSALNYWNISPKGIEFVPYNVRKETGDTNVFQKDDFIIVSADFSHFIPFETAIKRENTAAHSLMYKNTSSEFMDVVDDALSFKYLFKNMNPLYTLHWIGRERSFGEDDDAVGYLSFLIQEQHYPKNTNVVDGIFVTCYDSNLVARECLGEFYTNNNNKYSTKTEKQLKDKVIRLGKETSRLTGGLNKQYPILYYTVSYLYRDKGNKFIGNKFIRGFHTIKSDATYLSDVFLENTFNNGKWIDFETDNSWPKEFIFDLTETIDHLSRKAGHISNSANNPELEYYKTFVKNVVIKSFKGGKNNKTRKMKKTRKIQ